mgnify:CR=1 FL=1
MTTTNEIEAAMAEALEAVEKQAALKAESQVHPEPESESVDVIEINEGTT